VLFVARMSVLRVLMWALIVRSASATRAASGAVAVIAAATHRALKPRLLLIRNACAGRLSVGRLRRLRGVVRSLSATHLFLIGMLFKRGAFTARMFGVFAFLRSRISFRVFHGRFRGHDLVVHFVGFGVGLIGRVFMIVMQRILQIFQLGGIDERFGSRFFGVDDLFCFGLRFFVLGFGKLLGQSGYLLIG
jgi:hypothetical protein